MTATDSPLSTCEPAWDAVFALDFGRLGLLASDGVVVELAYLPDAVPPRPPRCALGREVQAQLQAYCRDPGHRFDLPLAPAGSPFQRRVWKLLGEIPRGSTLSYGEAARLLDSAPRPVGQACRANPFPPLVPCHRIVGAAGIGGFAGAGDPADPRVAIKLWLLRHEGALRG